MNHFVQIHPMLQQHLAKPYKVFAEQGLLYITGDVDLSLVMQQAVYDPTCLIVQQFEDGRLMIVGGIALAQQTLKGYTPINRAEEEIPGLLPTSFEYVDAEWTDEQKGIAPKAPKFFRAPVLWTTQPVENLRSFLAPTAEQLGNFRKKSLVTFVQPVIRNFAQQRQPEARTTRTTQPVGAAE
jgi:hypothetical protein